MCDIGFEIYVQNEKMECVKNAEKKEEHHRAGMYNAPSPGTRAERQEAPMPDPITTTNEQQLC